jgi:hypothetical protein
MPPQVLRMSAHPPSARIDTQLCAVPVNPLSVRTDNGLGAFINQERLCRKPRAPAARPRNPSEEALKYIVGREGMCGDANVQACWSGLNFHPTIFFFLSLLH